MVETVHRLIRQRKLIVIAALLPVAALCALLLVGRAKSADEHDPGEPRVEEEHSAEEEAGLICLEEDAQKLAGIQVERVGRHELGEYLEAPAVLHENPSEAAVVSAVVEGVVESVHAGVGERVTRGQIVATIRSAALAEAQANAATTEAESAAAEKALGRKRRLAAHGEFGASALEAAQRAYREAEEDLRLAESNAARLKRLAEVGAVSQPAAEEAATGLSEAREAVRSAEAEVEAARAELATAEQLAAQRQDGAKSVDRSAAEAKLQGARTALETAKAKRERLQRLLPDGLATEQEVQDAKAEQAAAQSDVAEREATLRTSDSALAEAQLAVAKAKQSLAQAETAQREAQDRLRIAETRSQRATTVAGEGIATQQQLAEVERDLQTARAACDQAKAAWEREKTLSREDLRTQEALSDLQTAVDNAGARQQAAARLVGVLGQGRQRAGGRLPLVAPASGKVSSRTARIGELVEAGAPLLEITGVRTVWVTAALYQRDLPRVARGQAMEIEIASLPGDVLKTTVYAIDAKLDEHTRKVTVRGLLDNPGGKLLPDMVATARIRVGVMASALAVPEVARQSDGDCEFVFVQVKSCDFRRTEVQTGVHSGGWVEIRSGIKAGDLIVTEGAFLLKSEGSAIDDTCGH